MTRITLTLGRLGISLALALGLFLAAPAASRAANIFFDDTAANDTITVTAVDFEGGFIVNGQLVQQGLGNPGSITVSEAGPLSFSGTWFTVGQGGAIDRTIYLVEAGDPTLVSDIFHYTITTNPSNGNSTIAGTFVSDFENNLGTLPPGTSPANVFIELGQTVNFEAAFLTGQIRSDVDPPASTPEPVSIVLSSIALGVLGLGALRRRQGQC